MYKVIESIRHGKNVKGAKRTSTIQVQYHPAGLDYYLLRAQFRFTVGNALERVSAMDKAIAFARKQNEELQQQK